MVFSFFVTRPVVALVYLGRSQRHILDTRNVLSPWGTCVWPSRSWGAHAPNENPPAPTQADPPTGVQSARRRLGARLWIGHVGRLIGGARHHPSSLSAGADGTGSGRSPDRGFLVKASRPRRFMWACPAGDSPGCVLVVDRLPVLA